jgi:hypothetical protein
VNLPCLDSFFSDEEIAATLSDTPPDHAPGPYGLKKRWNTIKDDFSRLFRQFCDGSLNIEFINGSFIVLILKIDSPRIVNDYRPISLLNSSVKFLTKIIANRL